MHDDNYVPITNLGLAQSKTITYVAASTGAVGSKTLFTVTGTVAVYVFGICAIDLASAGGTIEVGITGNTAAVIAQATSTDIDAGEFWRDATPVTVAAIPSLLMLNATNILQKITGATVSAGEMTYYCLWIPISSDGNVVAA